jgi:hypothetical protein
MPAPDFFYSFLPFPINNRKYPLFWLSMLQYLNYAMIAIALLASMTLFIQPNTDFHLKLFPLFLLVTVIVTLIGSHLSAQGRNNTMMYNIFSDFEFCFYIIVLQGVLHNKTARRVVLYVFFLYLAFAVVNMIFIQKMNSFNSISYALGSVLVAAVCIYYFFELFQRSNLGNLMGQPEFWICSCLLFYYCCSFPIFAMANFLPNNHGFIIRNVNAIIRILNIFLYSSFTIAFLCRIKVRKSMS